MPKSVKLNIAGMSCVNCSNAIERVAKKLDGVIEAHVNFANATGEFVLRDDSVREILEAKIKKLGYDIATDLDEFEQKRSEHIANMRNKFLFAFAASLVIMGLEILGKRGVLNDVLMLAVAFLTLVFSGRDFFTHAYAAIKNKNYDMNVLVALGTSSAFLYSLFVFLFPSALPSDLRNMYVSSSAMIIAFVLLGKYLEERSKARAGDYLKTLLKISPKTAILIKPDGQNVEVSVEELNIGDIVVVKNGYNVPCDGVIVQGGAEIDASTLTGESLPVYKEAGDEVFAGTLNTNGYISVKVSKGSHQTLLSQILNLLNDASTKKMPISRLADKIANIFVPSVICISLLALFVWIVFSGNFTYAVSSAICVLIISCPCALGLATPIAIITALARGAKDGILIKNPEVIELMKDVRFVAFDKTGTLSKGQISVKSCKLSHDDLLLAASVEALSEHPISKAVVKFAKQNSIKSMKLEGKFENIVGYGVVYEDDENRIVIGNESLLAKNGVLISDEQKGEISSVLDEGSGIILCAINGEFRGFISLSDELKSGVKEALGELENLGAQSVILSGDNEKVVSHIAAQLGVDKFYANMLPSDKFEKIKELSRQGKVVFVGDGINDSPSLKEADVGIAMNSGSDIAKMAGDIVLMKNDVKGVASSLKLGKSTMRTIKENLFWAFVYNVVCIPVAAGVLYPIFGILLSPVYGALAMCFSSVTVVLNSLRLRYLKF
ncbi:heavy metal translocating P-type ATPase [Campylobacter curvus]|uniref:heavy metal translocating P-type ATPase n=1 Tax=Campylobacter curvus TaxID=200 RepID=UPI00036D20F6|nr:heavy metal translocating P-type ATPase [Campylobacter curvus]QKF60857.1 copper-translocating P-type ATPase [Campylobacter curvus]UEB49178.1 heavy metal translocating P-type ATPase [Campylobacter curvus]